MKIRQILKIPDTQYTAARIMKWLWGQWRGNRLQAVLNAATGIAQVVTSLSQVWAVKHAIDVASGVAQGSIYFAVGIMAALILCDFALNIASVWVRNILGIKAQNRMQQRMLDRILRSEWRGREMRHSGDVLNRLEFDVNNVINFLTETIPNTLSVIVMFVSAFFCLFLMDKVLALVILVLIPIFLVGSKVYVVHMRRLTRLVRDSDSKVQSVLQDTVQHRMLIKTLENDRNMIDKLEHTQSELRQNVVRRTSCSVVSNLVLNVGFASGYLIAFLWAALRMSQHTLTFGGMTAFLQLVNKIQTPARSLTRLVPAFVSVLTAAERLMELEENPLEEQGEPVRMDGPCGIRLNDITYLYDGGSRNVIEHLTHDFEPGSCTAILGETGAGKTTLIRIILALLHPQHGTAEIYDTSSSHILSPLMRCNMVYVPQGNTLMSGTIRDNLLMGKSDATDEEMREALRKSCAEFVSELPDGLDTLCTEQGGGLSEGQAQRISIARALLRDRPVMLFDEATSALDNETECRLLQNIMSDRSKTIIFITHRPAVINYCDRTLRVERNERT